VIVGALAIDGVDCLLDNQFTQEKKLTQSKMNGAKIYVKSVIIKTAL